MVIVVEEGSPKKEEMVEVVYLDSSNIEKEKEERRKASD